MYLAYRGHKLPRTDKYTISAVNDNPDQWDDRDDETIYIGDEPVGDDKSDDKAVVNITSMMSRVQVDQTQRVYWKDFYRSRQAKREDGEKGMMKENGGGKGIGGESVETSVVEYRDSVRAERVEIGRDTTESGIDDVKPIMNKLSSISSRYREIDKNRLSEARPCEGPDPQGRGPDASCLRSSLLQRRLHIFDSVSSVRSK